MGTPMYMSPEQCRGLATIDHRSDVYSLGCVLYHLLTGRPPFDGEAPGDIMAAHIREPAPAPSSRVPELPPSIDALVLRCLAKAPAERFQTMAELTAALGMVLPSVQSDAAASAGPLHHLLPTTRMPPGGAPAPGAFVARPAVPTTLGASTGQFGRAAARRRRLGLSIAAGLVVVAAGSTITVIATRSSGDVVVTSRPDLVASQSGSSDGSGPRSAAAAPPAVQIEPRVVTDAGEQAAASATRAAPVPPPERSGSQVGPRSATESGGPNPPDAPSTAPVRRQVSGGPAAPRHRSEVSKPTPPPAKPARSTRSPAERCSKTVFAAVYNAESPSQAQIEEALGSLNECYRGNKINDVDFNEAKRALARKLLSKS